MKKAKTYLERIDSAYSILKDKTIPVYHFGIEKGNVELDALLKIAEKELNLNEISLVRPYSFGGDWYTHFEFVYNSDLK